MALGRPRLPVVASVPASLVAPLKSCDEHHLRELRLSPDVVNLDMSRPAILRTAARNATILLWSLQTKRTCVP
jgi:hypothetical protein